MEKIDIEKMLSDKGIEIINDSYKIRDTWTKAKQHASDIPRDKKEGREASANIHVMLSMLQDYLKGDYEEVSKHSLAVLIGTLVYCATPIDLIPDPIPAIGLSDDVALIIFAASTLLADIITYRNWKAERCKSSSSLNEYLDATVGDDPVERQKEIDRLAGIYNSVTASAAVRQEMEKEVSAQ